MNQNRKLRIIYPHHLRFLARSAHEILVFKTCHALAKRGHEVHLLIGKASNNTNSVYDYYGTSPARTLQIHELPILRMDGKLRVSWNRIFYHFCYRKIRAIQNHKNFDIILLSEIKLARFLHKKRLNSQYFYEIHGLYARNYKYPDSLEKQVFNQCRALITTTRTLKHKIKTLYPDHPAIYRVPLATEMGETFPPYNPPQPGKSWRIVYTGQLYPLQGLQLAIEALPLLPDWIVLEIVGDRKQDQILSLKELAERKDIAHRVTFHGFVKPSEVEHWTRNADILIAPCLAKGKMPYVAHTKIYEYLASGRPVIAADLPSIREEIEDRVNGILFEAGNHESLAHAIMDVVSNRELASNLAQNAWKYAQDFTWEKRAELLEKCFYQVLGYRSYAV